MAETRRRRDDARGVGQGFRALPRRLSRRRRARGDRPRRAAGARCELPDALQRASRCDRVQAAGARYGDRVVRAIRHRARKRHAGGQHDDRPATEYPLQGRSLVLLVQAEHPHEAPPRDAVRRRARRWRRALSAVGAGSRARRARNCARARAPPAAAGRGRGRLVQRSGVQSRGGRALPLPDRRPHQRA